jgi:hypothetical protein
MRQFSDYLVEYTSTHETERLEEFFGMSPSRVINVLQSRGFNCNSDREDVTLAISRINSKLSHRQIEEIANDFFDGKTCKETFTHSMFTRMN